MTDNPVKALEILIVRSSMIEMGSMGKIQDTGKYCVKLTFSNDEGRTDEVLVMLGKIEDRAHENYMKVGHGLIRSVKDTGRVPVILTGELPC